LLVIGLNCQLLQKIVPCGVPEEEDEPDVLEDVELDPEVFEDVDVEDDCELDADVLVKVSFNV
jgi:hypothetical protein